MCMSSQFGNIMRYDCVGVGTVLYYSFKNKAASTETACVICPRNRGGIAFAGADDRALYFDLIPLPSHVLTP